MAGKERTLRELIRHLLEQFDPTEAKDILVKAGDAAGLVIIAKVKDEYPPLPPQRGQYVTPLQTAKQLRWWWYNMREIAKGNPPPDSLRGWKAAYRKVNGVRTLVLSGHYKRTGTLVRSIDYDVASNSRGLTVRVGPTMGRKSAESDKAGDYGNYVIGMPPPDGPQARIHQDRWQPLQLIVNEATDEAYDAFFDKFSDEVYNRLIARGWTGI